MCEIIMLNTYMNSRMWPSYTMLCYMTLITISAVRLPSKDHELCEWNHHHHAWMKSIIMVVSNVSDLCILVDEIGGHSLVQEFFELRVRLKRSTKWSSRVDVLCHRWGSRGFEAAARARGMQNKTRSRIGMCEAVGDCWADRSVSFHPELKTRKRGYIQSHDTNGCSEDEMKC